MFLFCFFSFLFDENTNVLVLEEGTIMCGSSNGQAYSSVTSTGFG